MLKVQVPGRHAFVENKWLALAPACFFNRATRKSYIKSSGTHSDLFDAILIRWTCTMNSRTGTYRLRARTFGSSITSFSAKRVYIDCLIICIGSFVFPGLAPKGFTLTF